MTKTDDKPTPPAEETTTDDPHTAEQQEQITDLMDGLDGDEPSDDTPAQPEPAESGKAQPDGAEAGDGAAAAESAPEKDAAGAESAKADEPPKEEAKPEAAAEPDPLDTTFEVKSADGVRQVTAKDLVTTYQQFGNLQKQHVAIKPVFDLARQANVGLDQVYPLLVLGIETAMKARTGSPAPSTGDTLQAGGAPPAASGYSGPFASADEDARVKEADPTFYTSAWNQFKQLGEMREMFTSLKTGFETFQTRDQQTRQNEQITASRNDLEKRITDFAGTHTDYFKADPATGQSEKMNLFKDFLGVKFGHLDIADLTPEVLSTAFAVFDPAYYQGYLASQAKSEKDRLKEQDRQAFAETDNVSASPPAVQLNEQQEAMEGMLSL
ncbi:MAG: hypothetical protein HGJ93_00665 [Desulfosarcina sp.]|nr:hypothetical protein [Desulfosarcina sp.]MBC2764498.1 hypothetical protein [Desulfosarcina sp.]